jgi:hypothetical protein
MTLGDSGDFGDFVPRFPVYIPCRVSIDTEAEVLLIGMSGGNGHGAAPCVPLFSDHEQCLVFGKSCLFPMCVAIENAQSLANLLEAQMQRDAGMVVLDPPSRAEARGGFPISRAIQLLRRLSDPPEEA